MFEARKVHAHIKTTLQTATPGLVAEVQQVVGTFDKTARLTQIFAEANHNAEIGMPEIAAAFLSLAPNKSWRFQAATLASAYSHRAESTREHLQQLHIVNPSLESRIQQDLITAAELLTLSQRGRRTKPQQAQIA